MARSFINCFLALSLVVFAAFGLACTDTGSGGPVFRPATGIVVELYATTFDAYSIPILDCEYTSNQFTGTRPCGTSPLGGTGGTGFVYSAPLAESPRTVTISAMVSVNGATAQRGMCRDVTFLSGQVSYFGNYAQSEGSPDGDCAVTFSSF
jgi:hypothetical protein